MSDSEKKKKRGRGRPPGSRNKSKLIQAQLAFDNASELAAQTLVYLMKNDKDNLNTTEDIPPTIRLQACKIILDKAIANEKDKLQEVDKSSDSKSDEDDNVYKIPPKVMKTAN